MAGGRDFPLEVSSHRLSSILQVTNLVCLASVIEVNTGLILTCLPVLKPFFRKVVIKTLTDNSWSFGRGQVSWTGDTLRGNDDEGTALNHKGWYDVDRKCSSPPGRNRFLDGSDAGMMAAARSGSDSTVAPPVPPKDPDLENGKYGADMAGL